MIPLPRILADATRMKSAELAAAYGPAFFSLITTRQVPSRDLRRTERLQVDSETTGESAVFLIPLVSKNPARPDQLRVGRGDSCDIVIVDVTISKLHAFVQHNPGSIFSLLDAGSHNGTFVGEAAVAARGTGEPTPLTPRARVRFGSVWVTFVTPEDVVQLAARRAAM